MRCPRAPLPFPVSSERDSGRPPALREGPTVRGPLRAPRWAGLGEPPPLVPYAGQPAEGRARPPGTPLFFCTGGTRCSPGPEWHIRPSEATRAAPEGSAS